jgi:wyosine [tRNA(Phe)-imidazoG37] synthetase (radical SAM superfamily)
VTNGVLFTAKKAGVLLKHLTWVKVSIDAANPRTYSRIHGTKEDDFALVMRNLREAVKIRDARKYPCTIGAQFLLMPQNLQEAEDFVRLMKGTGIDYAAIKPYCQHPASAHRLCAGFSYKGLFSLEQRLLRHAGRGFRVVFRRQ